MNRTAVVKMLLMLAAAAIFGLFGLGGLVSAQAEAGGAPVLDEVPVLDEAPVLNDTPLLNETPVLNEAPVLTEERWYPGRLVASELVTTWTAAEVQAQSVRAFAQYGQPIIENDVELWLLTIATTSHGGEIVPITAQLFVPVRPPRGESPLLVYGSGTTGIGPACAPSREYLLPTPLGYYRELLAAYAGRGVVTVIPDYLGFDSATGPQAYFHAASEASALLDTARATREFFERDGREDELANAAFFGGYSQGGHAAFAVADRHAEYAPEVPVAGVMGFAATTDVRALLSEAAYYAPYVVLSYRHIYGVEVDPAEILAARWLTDLESTASAVCVDRAQLLYPFDGASMYTPAFAEALRLPSEGAAAQGFYRALAENNTGLSGHGVPALVVQGGRDVIISDATQERFVELLCEAGSAVRYVNYPEARHRDTRPAGFEVSLAWMRNLLQPGAAAPSDC